MWAGGEGSGNVFLRENMSELNLKGGTQSGWISGPEAAK